MMTDRRRPTFEEMFNKLQVQAACFRVTMNSISQQQIQQGSTSEKDVPLGYAT